MREERVRDADGIFIVFLNFIIRHLEEGTEHGSLQTATSGHTFERVQSSAHLLLLEDFFTSFLNDWDSCGFTNQFNTVNLLRLKTYR